MQNNHTIRRLCGLVLAIAPWLFMLWGVFEHGIIIGIDTLAKVGWFTLAMSAPIFLGAWLLFPMSQTFSNNEEKDSTTKE